MQLALNYSGKNDHNLKFRGYWVGHYKIRSSSPCNSSKYFFLHNFQGILFLTNNGTLRLMKKLLLWIECGLGNDSVCSLCTKVLSSGFIYKAIYRK